MEGIRNLVSTETPQGRIFNLGIMGLILFSLVCFTFETIPNLAPPTPEVFTWIEAVTVALFTVEYSLRFIAAQSKLRYVFSLYGLIDLMAILPFYISFGVDLRTVRILRLFRVFRLFKVFRYTKAMDRFRQAFREIQAELTVYMMATAMTVYLASVGIYYFEGEAQPDKFGSVFHCLWWSIVTLTTVGYGDVYPITVGGKIFTAVVLMAGIGTVAVPSGLFASALTRTEKV